MEQHQQMADPAAQAKDGANLEADAASEEQTSANDAMQATDAEFTSENANSAAPARPQATARNRSRNLTRTELEALRARLQKQFH